MKQQTKTTETIAAEGGKRNTFLESAPVGKLMQAYSIPCIISLLVAALYNIVDQIFIANATYLGSHGNAANTVIFPLTVIALAIAVMIGDGCCAFVSICLGAGRREDAHKSIGNAILLCILSSLLLTALYLCLMNPIIFAFGGGVSRETFDAAHEYFFWISLGIPFYMFGQAMNPIIRSDGSPRFAMAATVLGALVNIVLDPLFIYPLHMGMKGAAIATVLGQVLTALLSLWYLCHLKAVRLKRESFGFDTTLMSQYLPLGITSFLSQISLVFAMAALNNMLRKYGALDPVFGQESYSQIPMAVVGIVMKFFQIVISIAVGLAAGCIPIVGYNIGSGRRDRAKQLFTLLLRSEAAVGAVALLIVEAFPGQLIGIFGAGNESSYYTAFAIKSFRIYLCMMVLATVNKGTFIFLQSLGKAFASTFLSMVRELVFGVGFALLLPRFFRLDGVLYSMPLSDLLTFLIAAVIIWRTYQFLDEPGEVQSGIEEIPETEKTSITDTKTPAPLTGRIITIGRYYGAGGGDIGRKVAAALQIPFYDSALLEKAANAYGYSQKFLESIDEKPVDSSMLYRSIGFGTPAYQELGSTALGAQREIIEKVASEGSCVIVGRMADQVLKGKYPLLRVFLSCAESAQIERVMERDRLTREEAIQKINKVTRERSSYYNQLGTTRWGDVKSYDLCLNTDVIGQEETVAIIVSAARKQ